MLRLVSQVLGIATLLATTASSAAAIATVPAKDAYYTFRGEPSANSDSRLLAGKATAIGFPGQDSISFVGFDRADLPTALPTGGRALLKLEHDPTLAEFLIEATAANPVSLGAYAFNDPPGTDFDPAFDPAGGNNFDVNYGPEGRNAIATTTVGDPGVYTWDVTSLFETWLAAPDAVAAVAISGIYGNVGGDGRNAYGIFHTAGSASGMEPELHVTPLPGALPLLLTGGALLVGLRARRRTASG